MQRVVDLELPANSPQATWLVVQCVDRVGLLAEIAQIITAHSHNIKVRPAPAGGCSTAASRRQSCCPMTYRSRGRATFSNACVCWPWASLCDGCTRESCVACSSLGLPWGHC